MVLSCFSVGRMRSGSSFAARFRCAGTIGRCLDSSSLIARQPLPVAPFPAMRSTATLPGSGNLPISDCVDLVGLQHSTGTQPHTVAKKITVACLPGVGSQALMQQPTSQKDRHSCHEISNRHTN